MRFSETGWRELGRRLKPNLDLNRIESEYTELSRRLEEVIESWIRDGDNPSWEALAKAVSCCKKAGGKNVASDIMKKVGLGEAGYYKFS